MAITGKEASERNQMDEPGVLPYAEHELAT